MGTKKKEYLKSIKKAYGGLREVIEFRLKEFEDVWRSKDEARMFTELVFCLLTPQSKAKLCWGAVEDMLKGDVLKKGGDRNVLGCLGNVRFKYKKALFVEEARAKFGNGVSGGIVSAISAAGNIFKAREFFVDNVKGLGYKEASHFLRNIGLGGDLAILDRHILKNLVLLGVISKYPASLTAKHYLNIEAKMRRFSRLSGIPMDHLDLLLWYKQTGEVFK